MSQESPNSVEGQLQEMDTIDAGSQTVLKVEDNNQKMLDELFNLNSNSHLNCKPLKGRDLPSSFWKTHSSSSKQLCRQLLSSNQNSFSFDKPSPNITPFPQGTGTTPFPGANPSHSNTHFKSRNFPTVSHTRSRSSPATCYSHTSLRQHPPAELGLQDFHLQQQQQLLHPHAQHTQVANWNPDQQSGLIEQMTVKRQHQAGFPFDMSEFPTNTSNQGEMDFRGFSHPHSVPQLQQQLSTGFPSRHTRAHSNVDQLTLPLPKGWERGFTPEGDPFYIDHNSRTTSWTHPSLLQAGFFPQQGIGSPQHRPSCFQPGELSTIREIAQQQQLLSRMNLSDEPFYSHSHQGSQDSGIGIVGADHTVESVQTGEDFLLSKLDSSHMLPQAMSHEQIPFPGTNSTITDDHYLVDTPEVSEFQLHFQSTSPTHYDVSKLQASISTEMLLDAVSAVDPINPQNQP